ncbi:probable G-protein coupled receptor B0563.6 [Pomacea canaliculata]|uniref:probable G-protein coupled receptor B0563.6 n=1 Tax=Pomacea canaliculata TaxID=400727 RepID=UPI000D726112|nr:probable G-protein coupled receptor B0563.6 [Pomacea canaliculata]
MTDTMNVSAKDMITGSTQLLTFDNSLGDILSQDVYHSLNEAFSGYISTIICSVGIPANLVTCLVFWRQGLRDRMNLCLFCLAVVDLLYLLGVLPVFCVGALLLAADSPYAEEYFLKTLISGAGFIFGMRATSGCYNMIIAVERCVCVVFPLKAASLLHTHTMGVLLAVCFILIQLGYTVIPLQLRAVSVDVDGTIQWRYEPTQVFLDNKELFQTVEVTVLTVSLPIITFLVVVITAVITVIKLTAALKWREKTSSTCKEKVGHQTALTKMLLVVSFIYICSMVPSVSLTITRLVIKEFSASGRYYYLFMGSHIVANIFPLTHSAANFFVYYNRSSRFKSVFSDLLRRGSRRTVSADRSTSVF